MRGIFLYILICLCTISARGQEATPEYRPRRVVPRIRPITSAKFIDVEKVTNQVKDNELVLGVVIEGKARAYPINMLTGPRREIINDTLKDRAIAATW